MRQHADPPSALSPRAGAAGARKRPAVAGQAAGAPPPARRRAADFFQAGGSDEEDDSEASSDGEPSSDDAPSEGGWHGGGPSDDDSDGPGSSGGPSDADDGSYDDGVERGPAAKAGHLPPGVPLGALCAAQQHGGPARPGTPAGPAAPHRKSAAARAAAAAALAKRENKNRPSVAPSNVRPPRLRRVLPHAAPRPLDPRFDDHAAPKAAAGPHARRGYAFLFEETLPAEKADLVRQLKRAKSATARAELQARLTRVSQAVAADAEARAREAAAAGRRAVEKAAVVAGKGLYHPKRSEARRQELIAKYEALKAAGRLDAALAKRRKKNAAKDRRYLPSARREA